MKPQRDDDPTLTPLFVENIAIDPLDEARHTWKKGRYEFLLGGPITYVQGHNSSTGLMNNEREIKYAPLAAYEDPVAKDLQVDVQEQ